MANNKFQFKRTSTTGLLPNTTNAANSSYIAAGEFAVNLTDKTVVTSDGTNVFYVGSNVTSLMVTGSVTLNAAASTLTLGNSTTAVAISANGSNGSSGQVLSSNGTSVYWATPASGSFSNGTAYTWSAVQTFNSNVIITGNSTSQLLIGNTATNTIINASMITISGDNVATLSANQTFQNKRILPREITITSNATPTINTDSVDIFGITALAENITSFTTNLSGTPVSGQKLWIYIVGTAARTISWGASFEASTISLPNTTVSTDRLDVGFVWNANTSKWRCVGSA